MASGGFVNVDDPDTSGNYLGDFSVSPTVGGGPFIVSYATQGASATASGAPGTGLAEQLKPVLMVAAAGIAAALALKFWRR